MAKLIRLSDGLKVFYQKHANSSAFALGVFIGAGSFYENKQNNGISHFIEHSVFKGTESRTAFDIAEETDRCGVTLNAYTSRNLTAFYAIGLAEYAEKCADILSDILFRSTFEESNLEKEKNVVIEEIKMYEDDAEDICLENLGKAHYGNKSVAYPILGTENTVRSFGRNDILDYMHKYYRADNACVSIVGNMSEEEAMALVKKYFVFPEREDKLILPKLGAVKPKARYAKKIKSFEQSAIGISFPSYPYRHKQRFLPVIISNILGGGMSSRLFQEVREKRGLVYEIYSSNNQYDNNAMLVIYLGTAPSQAATAVKTVSDTLAQAVAEGFSEDEFQKAMAQLKTAMVFGGESASDLMRMGGRNGLINKLVTPESVLAELSAYTLEDVNRALREIIDFSAASLSYVGKKPSVNLFDILLEGRL